MNCTTNTSEINQTFIIEPLSLTGGSPTLSACTALYTNEIVSCSGDTTISLGTGIITFNSDLSANTINALNYFSGGTNLSSLISNGFIITGGTFDKNAETLTLSRNDNVNVIITGFTDFYTTGGTLIGATLYFDRNDQLSAYTVDLSSIAILDRYISGGTLSGNTLELFRSDATTISVDLTDIRFSGGSGNCITDFFVTNVHGCSPVTFHDPVIGLSGISSTTLDATTILSGGTNLLSIFDNIQGVQNVIDVSPSGGRFTSIKAAVDSITGQTINNQFVVRVGPGLYVEDTIVIPPYVHVRGSGVISTIIQASATTQNVFEMSRASTLLDCKIQGATSTGFAGVKVNTINNVAGETIAVLIKGCSFGNNNILINVVPTTANTITLVDYITVGTNNYVQGLVCSGNGTSLKFLIASNSALISSPITTDVVLASGVGSRVSLLSTLFFAVGFTAQTAVNLANGAFATITGSDIRSFSKGILMQSGGTAPSINVVGINMKQNVQDIVINHSGATGSIDGVFARSLSFLNPTCTVDLHNLDRKIIRVGQIGADYTTIGSAMNSITDNSSSSPYTILVGPGVFFENSIVIKPFVSVVGSGRLVTTVTPNIPSDVVFYGSNTTELENLRISGATDPTGTALVYSGSGMMLVSDVVFSRNTNQFVLSANTAGSTILLKNCLMGGPFTNGVIVRNLSGVSTTTLIQNMVFNQIPAAPVSKFFDISGTGNVVTVLGSVFGGLNSADFLTLADGARFQITSSNIAGFTNALKTDSGGLAPDLKAEGIVFRNNTNNIMINHSGTTGYFVGYSEYNKTTIPEAVPFFIANKDNDSISVAKKGGDFSSIKDALDRATGATENNQIRIIVGPGIFTEPILDIPSFVTLVGSSENTTIIEPDSNHNIFHLTNPNVELTEVSLRNAYSGNTGIFVDDCTLVTVNNVTFNDCDNNIIISAYTNDITFYGQGLFYAGDYNYGTKNISRNNFQSHTFLENYYNTPTGTTPTIGTYVEGVGAEIHVVTSTNHASGFGTAFYAIDGGSLHATAGHNSRWENTYHLPNIGAPTSLQVAGSLHEEISNYNLLIEHTGATGFYFGNTEFGQTFINSGCTFFIANKDSKIVTVAKRGGDFTSIYDAIAAITDSSINNAYLISVGPGIFTEPEMNVPSYISIKGSSIDTTIIQPDGNHDIFHLTNPNVEISFLSLKNAPAGYAGIFVDDCGNFVLTHKLEFLNCDINIRVDSNTIDTLFYGEYIDFGGSYSYGVKVTANNNFRSFANLENYYNVPSGTGSTIGTYASGNGAQVHMLTTGHFHGGNGIGLYAQDGAFIQSLAMELDGWNIGAQIGNVGTGSTIQMQGVSFTNNSTYDLRLDHPQTKAAINGSFDKTKVFVNPSATNVSLVFQDTNVGDFTISGRLNIRFPNNTITDVSTLLVEGATMGVIEGGELMAGTGFTVTIGDGFGYFEQFPDNDVIQRIDWPSTAVTLTANVDKYIYFNSSALLTTASSIPDTRYNILLGRAVTNSTGIEFIDVSKSNAEHTSNLLSTAWRRALGPIYSSGSIVTEGSLALTLNISSGAYYFAEDSFEPTGGSGITFTSVYRNGLGGYVLTPTNLVDATKFDVGTGTLSAITSSYYVKHSLYVVGQGVDEKYYLVYGQNEYATLLGAQEANIPSTPPYFKDSVSLIAGIIVQQGDTNIVQVRDLRPVVGFKSEGVNAAADHLSLLNLNTGDAGHHQFLMLNGSKQMVGTLDMNGNPIVSASTYNGITIETHASRHLPNGADPLATGIPVSVGTANATGIANALARQDHVHAHGNQPGGSQHALATSGSSGFMSAADKTYFDTIPNQFAGKADLSGSTFTGTINAPSISATTLTATTIFGNGVNITGLPYVTGGTTNNNTKQYTFTNSTGGTFVVNGLTDITVTGGTFDESAQSIIFTNNTGGTFSVTGLTSGGSLLFFEWNFSNIVTSGDPGTNKFRYNSTVESGVTEIYLDSISAGGTDMDFLLNRLTTNFDIFVQQNNDSNRRQEFNITGTPINNGGWWTIPVQFDGGSGNIPVNSRTCSIFFQNLTTNTDTYVTGGTYNHGNGLNGTLTFTNNDNSQFVVTGLTDVVVTGATTDNNTKLYTFTNNTGGTFSVTGLTDIRVTGATTDNNTKLYTFTNNTGGTFSVTGLTDIRVTGGTYNNNTGTATFTNNTGGTFSVTGFNTGFTTPLAILSGGTNQTGFTTNGVVFFNGTGLTNNSSWRIDTNSRLSNTLSAGTASIDLSGSTTSAAPLRIRSGVAPSSPNNGDVWNDSTQKTLSTNIASTTQNLQTVLFTQTSTGSVGNVTNEVSILSGVTGVGTITLPANFFSVGKTITLNATGTLSRAAGNVTIKFKIGGVTFATTGSVNPNNSTNSVFTIDVTMACRSIGTGGTVFTQGSFKNFDGNTQFSMPNTTTNTIDTTVSNIIDITYQQSNNNAGNSIASTNLTITTLN